MSLKFITEQILSDTADAIRAKTGGTATITPADFPDEIANIPSGSDTLAALLTGTLPDYTNAEITEIPAAAFFNARGTAKLSFPNATHIGNSGQKSLPGQAFLNYSGEIDLPDVRELTGGKNFMNSGIKEVNWSNWGQGAISNIGIGNQDFSGASLESVYINAGNAPRARGSLEISYAAFQNATKLRKVELHKSGDVGNLSIGSNAFAGCSILTALVLNSPGEYRWNLASSNAFNNTPIASGTGYIYVPRDQMAAYQAATNWTVYANQFRAIEDYTSDGTLTGEFIMPAN